MTLASDLNAFFLLSTLNIPKECHANKLRILTLFFLGIPAAAEVYLICLLGPSIYVYSTMNFYRIPIVGALAKTRGL